MPCISGVRKRREVGGEAKIVRLQGADRVGLWAGLEGVEMAVLERVSVRPLGNGPFGDGHPDHRLDISTITYRTALAPSAGPIRQPAPPLIHVSSAPTRRFGASETAHPRFGTFRHHTMPPGHRIVCAITQRIDRASAVHLARKPCRSRSKAGCAHSVVECLGELQRRWACSAGCHDGRQVARSVHHVGKRHHEQVPQHLATRSLPLSTVLPPNYQAASAKYV